MKELYTIVLILSLNSPPVYAYSCFFDPKRIEGVCAKMAFIGIKKFDKHFSNNNEQVYEASFKEEVTSKLWKAYIYKPDMRLNSIEYVHLNFRGKCGKKPMLAIGEKPDEMHVVDEADCKKINEQIRLDSEKLVKIEADYKKREAERAEFIENPELQSVIYVYFSTKIEKNGSISLILRNKENLEKYGLDFPSNNFTLIGSSRNYLSRSYISSGENELKAYKLVSIDKNGQVIEILAFNTDLETTKNKKPIQAKYVRAYFSKVKPVRKVQLFHKGVLITEKEFDYTRERID